ALGSFVFVCLFGKTGFHFSLTNNKIIGFGDERVLKSVSISGLFHVRNNLEFYFGKITVRWWENVDNCASGWF
ncbi:hypothetical protein, partial [Rhizobium sp.]|uniref:hypothetical protein n=1 Tax=Rhizobium sp. TaxID=391 RepID=UPI002AA7A008